MPAPRFGGCCKDNFLGKLVQENMTKPPSVRSATDPCVGTDWDKNGYNAFGLVPLGWQDVVLS